MIKLIKPVYADVNLGTVTGPGKLQQGGNVGTQFETLVSQGITALTVLAGVAFLVYFIYGAFNWITAGGKPENVASAQKTITNAAIGLIIVVVTYFIVGIIGSVIGLDILNPAKVLGL